MEIAAFLVAGAVDRLLLYRGEQQKGRPDMKTASIETITIHELETVTGGQRAFWGLSSEEYDAMARSMADSVRRAEGSDKMTRAGMPFDWQHRAAGF